MRDLPREGNFIFDSRARIIKTIGEEPSSNDYVGVIELVKNSYDEESPIVDINFDGKVKEMVDYDNLNEFKRIAKLDNPYAEGVAASFIRYYNRVGYPDMDSDLIISLLK